MKEHLFLAGFHAHRGTMPYVDAVNFAMELGIDPSNISAFIKHQMYLGHIGGDDSAYGVLHLTRAGRIFLMEYQEQAEEVARQQTEHLRQLASQKAEEVRNRLDDRKFQIKLAIFSAVLGLLTGLLLQYSTGIVELFISIID